MRFSTLTLMVICPCLFDLTACGGSGGMTAPPVISVQPLSLTVNAGSPATFTITAARAASYQWQRDGSAISGATAASYTLSPATSANNGDSYTVVVSNAGGSTTSLAATLRVTGVAVLAGQIGGEGYADGDSTQARFWGPAALALDTTGNLYVVDYNAVRKITPAGVVSTIVGSPRTCGDQPGVGTAALLCYPYAIALDAANNIYVADYLGTTIWRIDPSASMSAFSTSFGCIESLAPQGTLLYVGDSCGTIGAIKTIDTAAPGAPAQFVAATSVLAGLGFDLNQNIYVANDTSIQLVSAGVVSTLAGTQNAPGSVDGQGAAARFGCLPYAYGFNYAGTTGAAAIATLPSGTSYVSDYCNGTIRMVTAAGAVTTVAGTAGVIGTANGKGQNALFFNPAGIVADPSGNLFVADYAIGMIRKIAPDGTVTTYAGQAPHLGHADGPAAQATFCSPYGVAADSDGNLYVSDTYNYVIRKITPAGVVSTIAGTPGVRGFANATGAAAKFESPQALAIDATGNLYVVDQLNRMVRGDARWSCQHFCLSASAPGRRGRRPLDRKRVHDRQHRDLRARPHGAVCQDRHSGERVRCHGRAGRRGLRNRGCTVRHRHRIGVLAVRGTRAEPRHGYRPLRPPAGHRYGRRRQSLCLRSCGFSDQTGHPQRCRHYRSRDARSAYRYRPGRTPCQDQFPEWSGTTFLRQFRLAGRGRFV